MRRHLSPIRVPRRPLAILLLCLSLAGTAEAQRVPVASGQLHPRRLPPVDGAPQRPAAVPSRPPWADVGPELQPARVANVPARWPLTANLPPAGEGSVLTGPETVAAPTPVPPAQPAAPAGTEGTEGSYPVPDWLRCATVQPANSDCDGQRWISAYSGRIQGREMPESAMGTDRLPDDFRAWWEARVREPQAPALYVSIDQLINGALHFSSYVQVVAAEPQIRRTAVVEEQAAFDWRGFLDTTYNDVNVPVGNVLTTGTLEDRYKDQTWKGNFGVRQDNILGGKLELSQQMGTQQNNSRFLLPNPQATTQLELRYTQPLLNGAGRAFNESRIVLAGINADISSDKLFADLEEHLIKVTEAYWELYRSRAAYYQRLKLLESAKEALAILEARGNVDAVQRQVLRAGCGRLAALGNRPRPHVDSQRGVPVAAAGERPRAAGGRGSAICPHRRPVDRPLAAGDRRVDVYGAAQPAGYLGGDPRGPGGLRAVGRGAKRGAPATRPGRQHLRGRTGRTGGGRRFAGPPV